MENDIIEIKKLDKSFGDIHAVDNLSFNPITCPLEFFTAVFSPTKFEKSLPVVFGTAVT